MTQRLEDILKYSKNMTVLYVEDDYYTRESIVLVLQRFFTNIIEAVDGEDGLKKFDENKDKIDIIISDINMPNLDGLEMIEQIKQRVKDMPPAMLFSAYNETDYLIQAIKLSVDAYLFKPFDKEQFLQALEKIIKKINLFNENQDYKENLEKKVQEQVKQISQKQQELNLLKNELIAIFTHELKTPLNAIINFSDYIYRNLQKTPLSEKKLLKLISLARKINENGLVELNMVQNILEVSKSNLGKTTLDLEMVNLKFLIDGIINRYAEAYNKKVLSDIEDVMYKTDKVKFSMIFDNLFSNALKYCNSVVKIILKKSDTGYILTIEDDGDGIAKKDREKIFELFEQLNTETLTREKSGTGVGLYTVKLLCDQLEQRVSVETSSLGGAKFILTNK